MVVECMRSFDAGIRIQVGSKTANAASIMSLLALGANTGTEAHLTADGPDAEVALEAVISILTSDDEQEVRD